MTIIDRFLFNIKTYNLLEKNDTIIIGASGGPDSQFLVYLFNQIKEEYNLKIILAHLNHLHRKEASNDENLLVSTGEKLGLEVKVKRASMDEFAKNNKISAEDAGRRLRYDFFYNLANNYDDAKIAVAHNMNDQAETMLFRMVRGTGLDGLSAMDYKNGKIIRPILSFEKSEILKYLDENNIEYAIDATNLENDYSRNYIRNEIFPRLSEINYNAISNFFNLSNNIKNDLEIIDEIIEEIYKDITISEGAYRIKFDRKKFELISDAKKSRVLRIAINKLKGNIKDFSRININKFLSLEKLETGKKIIKDDIIFTKNYKSYDLELIVGKKDSPSICKISLNEEIIFNGKNIKTSKVSEKTNKSKNVGYFDMDKLLFPLFIRTRKNGDRFYPLGMKHSKKVKDFFIDEKVDKNTRDEVPLILSDNKIIWVAGYRISEEFKVDKGTKNILKIEVAND